MSERSDRGSAKSSPREWQRPLLAALVGTSGVVRLSTSGTSATMLAVWGRTSADAATLGALSLVLGGFELLLGLTLLPRTRRSLAVWVVVGWNCAISVLCAVMPASWNEYFLLGVAPVARIGLPGAPQLVGWTTLLLAWAAWHRTQARSTAAKREPVGVASVGALLCLSQAQCAPPTAVVPSPMPLDIVAFEHGDPRCENLDDLAGLAHVFDGVRVVILGEIHRDGSAYALKTRLVRYLHEVEGFDVLAWESSLLECAALQARLATVDGAAELGAGPGIDPLWAGTPYMEPLFDYVLRARASARPLEIVGLDCKLYPPESRALDREHAGPIASDIGGFIRASFAGARTDAAEIEALASTLEAFVSEVDAATYPTAPGRRDEIRSALSRLAKLATKLETAPPRAFEPSGFLERVLRAAQALEEWSYATSGANGVAASLDGSFTNPRDRFMAETLSWYCDQVYPGRRVIVWTGGFHGLADPNAVRFVAPPSGVSGRLDGMRPFAQLVHEELGSSCYVVNTTSVRGTFGSLANPRTFERPEPWSLEANLDRSGALAGFVDFRSQLEFVAQARPARILGDDDVVVELGRAVDGVLFSRTAFPERPVPLDSTAYPNGARVDATSAFTACRALLASARADLREAGGATFSSTAAATLEMLITESIDRPLTAWSSEDPGSVLDAGPGRVARRYELSPLVPVVEHEPVVLMLESGARASSALAFLSPTVLVGGSADLDGELRFRDAALVQVAGDVIGTVVCDGPIRLSSAGALDGVVVLRRGGRLCFENGLGAGGRIEFEGPGGDLELGGFTPGSALERVRGPAAVVLRRSDLSPGRHRIGSLDVLVRAEG
ncbi:MAG: erythromycin esterase family protein [Planctomycetes bacterium]|nr:erythromycin esterase family protein [Planctomycetota bacterium]